MLNIEFEKTAAMAHSTLKIEKSTFTIAR